jgi:hypothetical protein
MRVNSFGRTRDYGCGAGAPVSPPGEQSARGVALTLPAALQGPAPLERAHVQEGWGRLAPVRHALGAGLMKAGQFAEAEEVYQADLTRLPENGWSLLGLAQSLRSQDKAEAAAVEARFRKVWAKADLPIASSCLCQEPVQQTAAVKQAR